MRDITEECMADSTKEGKIAVDEDARRVLNLRLDTNCSLQSSLWKRTSTTCLNPCQEELVKGLLIVLGSLRTQPLTRPSR